MPAPRSAVVHPRAATPDRRAARGPRSVEECLSRLLEPAARRRGFEQARLLESWAAIVGADLAPACQPIRLARDSGGAGGVLHLRVSGAAALEVQHLEPLIVERINVYFGRRAVARLRLVQAPPPPPPRARPRPRPATAAEMSEVGHAVEAITPESLREALRALGLAVRVASSGPGRGGDGGRH